LLEASSEYFGLNLAKARRIIKEVATITSTWRDVAREVRTNTHHDLPFSHLPIL
jgi:serine/threonine-protein kinase HipA